MPVRGLILLSALVLLAACAEPAPGEFDALAPVVERSCVDCHRPGGPAPFALSSYRELRESARESALVTESGWMPPWLPEGEARFAGDRRLSPEEIALFEAWLAAERPAGEATIRVEPAIAIDGISTEALPVAPDAPSHVHEFFIEASHFVERPTAIGALRIGAERAHLVRHVRLQVERDGTRRDPGQLVGWLPGVEPEPLAARWVLHPQERLVLSAWIAPDAIGGEVRLTLALEAGDRSALRRTRTVSDGSVVPEAVTLFAIAPLAPADVRALHLRVDGQTLFSTGRWDPAWREVYRFLEPVALEAGATVEIEVERARRVLDNRPDRPFAGRIEVDLEINDGES